MSIEREYNILHKIKMTKKRKKSIDETFSETLNTCLQQSMKKSKLHPGYHDMYSKYTVPVLREIVRNIGNKKWYSLRKANLVCFVIVHRSSSMITRFFKRIYQKKIDSIIEESIKDGSTCPITLDPVSEILNRFVHDGIVFSGDELIKYMMVSVDFCNPITRNMMSLIDIKRLCSPIPTSQVFPLLAPELLEKYNNREALRHKEVESIRDFSFWETELDNILISLGRLFYDQGTEAFNDCHRKFHDMWIEMKRLDRNRTLIVLMSMKQSANRFRGRPRQWVNVFIDSYYNKT